MANDREVWTRICRQDAAAFELFHRANAPRLEAFLRQIVQNRQAAEDLTQETFIRFWNRPEAYQPDRGSLHTWLFGVGRNLASEWWRRQKPSEPLEEHGSPDSTESHSVLGDVFRQLPEDQRTLLWLREVEGQSYTELAATLGIPIGTVRSRLFSARQALRLIWNRNRSTFGRRSA
ncbi:MAG: RNA polymerase sigma factor [Terracidiphilus sp.]